MPSRDNNGAPVIVLGVHGALRWIIVWVLAHAFVFYVLMEVLTDTQSSWSVQSPTPQLTATQAPRTYSMPKKSVDIQGLVDDIGKSPNLTLAKSLDDLDIKRMTTATHSHEDMVQLVLGQKLGNLFIQKHQSNDTRSGSEHQFILNNKTLCGGARLKLLICIFSKPSNFEQRDKLRSSWAQTDIFSRIPSRTVFFTGQVTDPVTQQLLVSEHGKFGDIVQGNYIDSPWNLSMKSISSLKWASTYCKNADYFAKVQDIFYVNVFHLARIVTDERVVGEKRFILGRVYHDSMPILRTSSSVYNVPNVTFPGLRVFPTYASGVLYVMNNDLTKTLYGLSLVTPWFHIEDVYVTGILAGQIHGLVYLALTATYTPYGEEQFVRDLINRNNKKGLMFVSSRLNKLWAWHVRCLHEEEIRLMGKDKLERVLKKTDRTVDGFLK